MMALPSGVVRTDDGFWRWQDEPAKSRRGKKPQDLNQSISRSLVEGGYWERGVFTVPLSTTEERVKLLGYKYVRKFGEQLERRGLSVHLITPPGSYKGPLPVEPDRRKYIMFAWVSRRPFEPIYQIPDKFVPEMLKAGLRLLE